MFACVKNIYIHYYFKYFSISFIYNLTISNVSLIEVPLPSKTSCILINKIGLTDLHPRIAFVIDIELEMSTSSPRLSLNPGKSHKIKSLKPSIELINKVSDYFLCPILNPLKPFIASNTYLSPILLLLLHSFKVF